MERSCGFLLINDVSYRLRNLACSRHIRLLFLLLKQSLFFKLRLLLFKVSLDDFFKLDLEARRQLLVQSGSLIDVAINESEVAAFDLSALWSLDGRVGDAHAARVVVRCIGTSFNVACLILALSHWLVLNFLNDSNGLLRLRSWQ